MNHPAPSLHASRRLRRLEVFVRAHPRLLTSTAVGVAGGLAMTVLQISQPATRALLGWNLFALTWLLLAGHLMWRAGPQELQRRAAREDDGRLVVLTLAVAASAAVLVAVATQLSALHDVHGPGRLLHLALAAATVAGGWLVTQVFFALHYAHEFVAAQVRGEPPALQFPGSGPEGYGDFLYVACVIGTSGQTADVSFGTPAMRRVGLLHCVQAFFFNTTVLALTINIAAGLF